MIGSICNKMKGILRGFHGLKKVVYYYKNSEKKEGLKDEEDFIPHTPANLY